MNDLFKLNSIDVEGKEKICTYLNISDHYAIKANIQLKDSQEKYR